MNPTATLLALFALGALGPTAPAAGYRIVREESGFVVVTHKAGIAARFAHDHLIVAGDYEATLAFDPSNPEATRFEFATDADDLLFDPENEQARWYPLVEELGVLDEPFKPVDRGDREEIRARALGRSQLDAASHASLSAAVVGIEPSGDETMPWRVTLAFEAHGTRVERPVAARYRVGDDGRVTIDATGPFRFTEFGFKPYSAMLGAVRNRDEFDVVVRIVAVPDEPLAPADTDANRR